MIRKFMVSLGVFFTFVVYSFGIRHQLPKIAAPQSLKSSSSSNAGSGSSTASSTGSQASSTASSNSSTTASSGSGSNNSSGSSAQTAGKYKDGNYTGKSYNAYWGNVQVSVSITNGKISNVKFLQYPNTHSTSVYINQQVMPYLKQEAIKAQSSNVQLISGATFTSQAFQQSLQSALSQA